MKRTALVFCIYAIILPACVPTAIAPPTAMPSPSQLPSQTPPPTSAPTPTPEGVTKTCPEIATALPTAIDGTIVLNGAYSEFDAAAGHVVVNSGPAYLWNLNTGTKINLPRAEGEEFLSFSVSPNRRWLVYEGRNQSTDRVVITSSDGKTFQNIVNAYHWFLSEGWINNQQLAIWMLSDVTSGRPFPTLIYDPFTQNRKLILPADYPDISVWDAYGWRDTQTVYDPSLLLVVYPDQGTSTEPEGVVLWDISKRQRITFLPTTLGAGRSDPVWSDDGQHFVIGLNLLKNASETVQEELFSVSRDGTARQLTYLTRLYNDVEFQSKSWSPDGQSIAFIALVKPENDKPSGTLFGIFDLETGKVLEYCDENLSFETPIWSPDGKQILLTGISANAGQKTEYKALLLDIQKNELIEIAKDQIPEGWLANQK